MFVRERTFSGFSFHSLQTQVRPHGMTEFYATIFFLFLHSHCAGLAGAAALPLEKPDKSRVRIVEGHGTPEGMKSSWERPEASSEVLLCVSSPWGFEQNVLGSERCEDVGPPHKRIAVACSQTLRNCKRVTRLLLLGTPIEKWDRIRASCYSRLQITVASLQQRHLFSHLANMRTDLSVPDANPITTI